MKTDVILLQDNILCLYAFKMIAVGCKKLCFDQLRKSDAGSC